MAISPFSARPASPGGDGRRTRLALAMAAVGIAAILLAYAISPGVRHAVSHAEHSVKHAVSHAVSHMFGHHHKSAHAHPPRLHLVQPLVPRHDRPAHRPPGAGVTTTSAP